MKIRIKLNINVKKTLPKSIRFYYFLKKNKNKIKKTDLGEISDPNEINPIKINITFRGYNYESIAEFKINDKTKKTKYIFK
jgi:hypothetical protein